MKLLECKLPGKEVRGRGLLLLNSKDLNKDNQDSCISIPVLGNKLSKKRSFYGVFDGHGVYGHLCSNFVKKNVRTSLLFIYF